MSSPGRARSATSAGPPEPSLRAAAVKAALATRADPAKAVVLRRFFKTGPGEYGAGDEFLGVTVPAQRLVAREFDRLPHAAVLELLQSAIHEHRLTALLIWVRQFERGDEARRREIHETYLGQTRWVNNWDLVDTSAPTIVGTWLATRSRRTLDRLAASANLWERRIAMLATFAFIRAGELAATFVLADRLLADPEDLMHKAVGWMLREAGKRDRAALEEFLATRAGRMPRTMLRYAIERFPPTARRRWLNQPQDSPRRGRSGPAFDGM